MFIYYYKSFIFVEKLVKIVFYFNMILVFNYFKKLKLTHAKVDFLKICFYEISFNKPIFFITK